MSKAKVLKNDGVKIDLDKERTLLLDFNTFVDLEDEYGSLDKGLRAVSSQKVKDVRKIMWLLLRHEDESLTEKEVGRILPLDNSDYLIEKLLKTIELAMPEKDKNQKN
ncbi:hypothetical protein ACQKJC_08805 [Priestia koreensis]|uniref:hypothetical protein n=1 Tax=Priestia koreensis TaxID=284581 RepID=UPI003CFBEBEC